MVRNSPSLNASAVLLIILCLLGVPLAAAAESAEAFLKKRHDAVTRVLKSGARTDAETKKRDDRLAELLGDLLDYPELSKRALGAHWEARSEAERQEFMSLLRGLVDRSYQKNLERTLGYELRYLGEEPSADAIVVRTSARSRKNRREPEVTIEYRVRKTEAGFRVFDIVTDGVSMVDNYRSQFHRIIAKESWSGLLQRMRSRLESNDGF